MTTTRASEPGAPWAVAGAIMGPAPGAGMEGAGIDAGASLAAGREDGGGATWSVGVPQNLQKRAPGSSSPPQLLQWVGVLAEGGAGAGATAGGGAEEGGAGAPEGGGFSSRPHPLQYCAWARLTAPQREQPAPSAGGGATWLARDAPQA